MSDYKCRSTEESTTDEVRNELLLYFSWPSERNCTQYKQISGSVMYYIKGEQYFVEMRLLVS